MKRLLMVLALVLGASAPALAQVAIPNTLVAGTTIRASDLNTNFSTLGNHALDRLSGGNISGNVTLDPGVTLDGIDIGAALCTTCSATFKNLTLSSPTTGLTIASNVIVDSTGKIPALTSTYFTSLALDAANLTGTIATARMGTGTGTDAKFLRGDGTWTSVLNITEYDAGNSGTSKTLDFATNGPLQKVTRTGSCTFTLTAPSKPGMVVVKMVHEASATAYTVTFSPTVKWPGGTSPTWTNTSGAIDLVSLYWDGTSWFGVQTANYS